MPGGGTVAHGADDFLPILARADAGGDQRVDELSVGDVARLGVLPENEGLVVDRVVPGAGGRVVDALEKVAEETGRTVPQIAINWLLTRPTVANVIIGARTEEQLKQNLGAIGWKLTPGQVAQLDAASQTPKVYPYWHQAGFEERNPSPVPRER